MDFEHLIKHLSVASQGLFEGAVAEASSRSHFTVDIEHCLWEAIKTEEQELTTVFRHFGIEPAELAPDMVKALDGLKTGNAGFPTIAPDVARMIFDGWMLAASHFSVSEVRPVHLLLAILESDALKLRLGRCAPKLQQLSGEDVRAQCMSLLSAAPSSDPKGDAAALTKTPALDQFTIDLTARAKEGAIDPVLGRDTEIRQVIDILCRRRQNNPILTGEAGVGKTSVVEGLALRIAEGTVPAPLADVAVRVLDLGLLQAGAGVKGEFERRLKEVIKEVQSAITPVVLFIDEAHTLIGASGTSGAGDAANLLKPALARGELRTIAATTWAEYKKYFETDAALTRRFQVVKVEEPDEATATVMLRSLVTALERHHGVTVLEEAVRSAVKLSHRYITGRQMPDKCVSLLDTACARVSMSLYTTPPSLEADEQRLRDIETESARLERERAEGFSHTEVLAALAKERAAVEERCVTASKRWRDAQRLVNEIAELRKAMEGAATDQHEHECAGKEAPERRAQRLVTLREKLTTTQGDVPLIYECVDAQVVAEVVSDWTGIPVGRMQQDQVDRVLSLHERLGERVLGQDHAIELISKAMRTAGAKLADPRRPLGVFLLAGPSGVGKTETALALAEQLYGSEKNITVLNMSEFKEEHKVSLLMGSPPGYVGYGEGGMLTEAVRKKPYSVVLLDEMEKAHPGVQDIFYQVFDKGMLRDGEGRDIDFKNTVILMTSNTASEQIEQLCADPETRPTVEGLTEAIGPALREVYKPAFLGRVSIVPYYPLDEDCIGRIARIQLEAIQKRVKDHYSAELTIDSRLVNHIIAQCATSDTGARQVHNILNNTILPALSESILKYVSGGQTPREVKVGIGEDGSVFVSYLETDPFPSALKALRGDESAVSA